MKILDKYIAKNFLTGYLISFAILMGMRIIIDLFVNIDEFTEHANLNVFQIARNIAIYYGLQSAVYFRDFAGIITVIAAVFSLGKLTRNNELIAVMASGVSLKRVIAPIIFLSILITGLLVIDQELLIPPFADKIVREKDVLPGQETYDVWYLNDSKGSLFCSQSFDVSTKTLLKPVILQRKKLNPYMWEVVAKITADSASFDSQTSRWELVNGAISKISGEAQETTSRPISSYESDLTPRDIPIRRQARNISLLSSSQLSELARQKTKIKDQAMLYSQKHFRVTDPIVNFIMLLVALPILVCRDPKLMKTAIGISFATTSACFLTSFICKMMATEVVFNSVKPELWAWMPVFIFLPIALIEIDSMKT